MREFFHRKALRFTPAQKDHRSNIPDNLWIKCPACQELRYQKELDDHLKVCKCGYHFRLGSREWLSLLDPGSFVEEDTNIRPCDPLNFVSPTANYTQKLHESQERCQVLDAIVSGCGKIASRPLQIAVTEFAFIGGSMGSVFGEKVVRAAERAAWLGMPLLTVNASGGARMHEGVFSLMQMAKINAALRRLSDAGQPHIALLTDPCFGGVTASYASVADIIIAEPGANIGFAGRRVIEQTIRQKLPPHFQTAEFLLEHGMIDMVVPRSELRTILARLLHLYAIDVPASVERMLMVNE